MSSSCIFARHNLNPKPVFTLLQQPDTLLSSSPPALDHDHAQLIDALVLLLCDADASDVRVLLQVDGMKTAPSSSTAPVSAAVFPAVTRQIASEVMGDIGSSDKMNAIGDVLSCVIAMAIAAATIMLATTMLILTSASPTLPPDMAVQPEALLVSNIGDTMGMFGSAVVQLAEAVKELNSQQQQQQQQEQQQKMLEQQERQQQHHFLLQKLAEEHHLQLLQHQQQLLQQQQQQLVPPPTLPQVSADYVPPAIEARLLLMEEVRCRYWRCVMRHVLGCR